MSMHGNGPRLPDFVVIGAPKCGTNWLNECLREHPDVFLTTKVHEISYFDRYFDRGPAWYARYFSEFAGQKRVGDVTPTYMAHPDAPQRVHQLLPDATLIVSMRNPVDRAWSRYLHAWRKGDVPSEMSFRDACRVAPEILEEGRYAHCLQRWLALFPSGHVHCLFLDDARVDPHAFISRLYELIGVDPHFQAPSITEKTNEHQTPRSMLLARIAFRCSRFFHRYGLHRVVDAVKAVGFKRLVLQSGRDARKDPPPLTESDRAWLADYYRPDIRELAALTARDLIGEWLSPQRPRTRPISAAQPAQGARVRELEPAA